MAAFILSQVGHPVNFTENCTLGIEDDGLSEVKLYPIPTNEILTIESSNPIISIEIYTILGQMVKQETLSENVTLLNVSFLSKGIYLIVLKDSRNRRHLKKIIKK